MGDRQSTPVPLWSRIFSAGGQVLLWIVLSVGLGLFFLARWILASFGPITVNQALLNLPGFGSKTSGTTTDVAPGLVNSFILEVLVATACVLSVLLVLVYGLRTVVKRKFPGKLHMWSMSRWIALAVASVLALGTGIYRLDSAVNLRSWLFPNKNAPTIDTFYAEPVLEKAASPDRNLVFIYLESMDDAFGNSELVEANALQELQDATANWETMDSLTQYPGGGWTMAGIVSSQCGIPLLPPPSENDIALDVESEVQSGQRWHNDLGAEEQWYLPGATCLGDILKDSGYTNVYMGGAYTSFANKDKFLKTHGFDTIFSRTYWEEQGETEFSEWGLSDRRLFENAEEQVLLLHQSDQPFNLTMLTLDNHSPIHQFDYCPTTLDDDALNAVQCQSSIVANFIQFMDEHRILDDTAVVVVADHQILSAYGVAEYRSKLDSDSRSQVPIFSRFWSPDGIKLERKVDNQLHIFPTVVDMLGGRLQDHRGGLGVSLTQREESSAAKNSIVAIDNRELSVLLSNRDGTVFASLWEEPSTP